MADAYLDRTAFEMLPRAPTSLRAHGAWVTIRANATGVITAMNDSRLATIRGLPSFSDEYVPLGVGSRVAMTIDACTVHGCFNLAHADGATLAADYEAAQALVEAGLFEIAPEIAPEIATTELN
jgi:hypothetical protein